jgi:hypothetical protein
MAMQSAISAFMPPIACFSRSEPSGSSLAQRLFPSASLKLTWTWKPLPAWSAQGLAMKVASQPWRRATPLAARL